MGTSEDNKTPKHVKKFKGLKKKADEIAATAEVSHSEAYTIAVDSLLKDKKGIVHYDLLEKEDMQQKFVDKMVEHYIRRANEYFKTDIDPKDRIQVDQLLKMYSGATKTQLEKNLLTYGKKYTIKKHESERDEFIKEVKGQLHASAGAHLRDEHAIDFVKDMGIEDIVDASKMGIKDIIYVHGAYEAGGGALTRKSLKEFYQLQGMPEPIHLKEDAKKQQKYKQAKAA